MTIANTKMHFGFDKLVAAIAPIDFDQLASHGDASVCGERENSALERSRVQLVRSDPSHPDRVVGVRRRWEANGKTYISRLICPK